MGANRERLSCECIAEKDRVDRVGPRIGRAGPVRAASWQARLSAVHTQRPVPATATAQHSKLRREEAHGRPWVYRAAAAKPHQLAA